MVKRPSWVFSCKEAFGRFDPTHCIGNVFIPIDLIAHVRNEVVANAVKLPEIVGCTLHAVDRKLVIGKQSVAFVNCLSGIIQNS